MNLLTMTDQQIVEANNEKLQEILQQIARELHSVSEKEKMYGQLSSADQQFRDELTRKQGQVMGELGGRGCPVNSKGQRQSGHYGQGVM